MIGARERTEARTTDRDGTRPGLVSTQACDIGLRIPRLRKGLFFPTILERYRRVDQAPYPVVMEANVQGMSTRSVDDLPPECPSGWAKGRVFGAEPQECVGSVTTVGGSR